MCMTFDLWKVNWSECLVISILNFIIFKDFLTNNDIMKWEVEGAVLSPDSLILTSKESVQDQRNTNFQ
jgi:hypothetical protein